MRGRKKVILLGASGSIGKSTLDVIRAGSDRLELVAASVHGDLAAARAIRSEFAQAALCVSREGIAFEDATHAGRDGLARMIRETEADVVLNAIPGAAGIEPSMAAAESGKDLALANKETMVCAGRLVKEALSTAGRRLLPVDSEHSALFHLLEGRPRADITELVITASGGPLRDAPVEEIADAPLERVLAHPTWSMGRKITIDSATMANKGLEVIEAIELFGFPPESIRVVVHPESMVHSLVRYRDGSLYAQISKPDMRLPIHNALYWPEKLPCPFGALDLAGTSLSFRAPDPERYPLLALAYEVVRRGGSYPIAYNAANEVAVEAYVSGGIRFGGIASAVAEALGDDFAEPARDIGAVLASDSRARESARKAVKRMKA